MFKFYGGVSLIMLAVFASINALMQLTGQTASYIVLIHEGLIGVIAAASIIAAIMRGVPFWNFATTMAVIALSCLISILGAFDPGWAIVVGVVYAFTIAALIYREWFDTPYGTQAGWFAVSNSRLGDVVVDPAGRTHGKVEAEIRTLTHPPNE